MCRGLRWSCAVWAVVSATALAHAGEAPGTAEMLLRVKPAVAIVTTEITGEVRLACPRGAPQRVTPDSIRAHGTGFLIDPDGYLVTNGHVVQPYYGSDDSEARETLVRQAIDRVCVKGQPTSEQRRGAVARLYPMIARAAQVDLKKTLTVVLPNRERFAAEVKAYSPPLADTPGKQDPQAGQLFESGKDIAILKIDARNLPTLALADSDNVRLGQNVHLFGFPGVVFYHDLLDKRSALEVSVTAGQVSSVKRDARGAPVIQTDAAASWGNSGGPGVNDRGDAIGVLTFISLTADEMQAIQGFNFLVPANIVREFARTSGARLDVPSPFNTLWYDAVARFSRGDWAGAQTKLDAAARLVPNLPDVQRLQAETEIHLLKRTTWRPVFLMGAAGVLVMLALGAVWMRRRRRPVAAPAGPPVAAPDAPAHHADPLRVAANDLGRALAQRSDLVIVDVRGSSSYAASGVQAKGAVRASADTIRDVCANVAPQQGIVVYCESADETESVRAARRLIAAGYTRVAVLTGGFAAWEQASLPLERNPDARVVLGNAKAALPSSQGEPSPIADVDVDLPIGVQGAGPYFNARLTRLGLTHVVLKSDRRLTVGQRLLLTVFITAEPFEIGGTVASVSARSVHGESWAAGVTLDVLSDEKRTMLEGLVLTLRTAGSASAAAEAGSALSPDRGPLRQPT